MSLLLSPDELHALTGLRRPCAVVRRMAALGAPAYVNAAGQAVVPRLWYENWCKGADAAPLAEEYHVRLHLLPGGKNGARTGT